MGKAKEIIVKVLPARIAHAFMRQHHYSGKIVGNSSLHFGCFLDNQLHGVMSFGPSMDKSKLIHLVKGTGWNEFIELNRMAFDDHLPRNSESRCISIAIRLIKKNAPHVKWIISFSDATASGDGTIYRASGFQLTGIRPNSTIYEFPDGERIASLTLTNTGDLQSREKAAKKYGVVYTTKASMKAFTDIGAKKAPGWQMRYIYMIDRASILTVPVIPFSKIDDVGGGMYLGQKITIAERQLNTRR